MFKVKVWLPTHMQIGGVKILSMRVDAFNQAVYLWQNYKPFARVEVWYHNADDKVYYLPEHELINICVSIQQDPDNALEQFYTYIKEVAQELSYFKEPIF